MSANANTNNTNETVSAAANDHVPMKVLVGFGVGAALIAGAVGYVTARILTRGAVEPETVTEAISKIAETATEVADAAEPLLEAAKENAVTATEAVVGFFKR